MSFADYQKISMDNGDMNKLITNISWIFGEDQKDWQE